MTDIVTYFSADHRHCDDVFAEAEQAAAKGEWETATSAFNRFRDDTLAHFATEEEVLFPAFEQRTGFTGGPTQVMRMEHVQMRDLLNQMAEALTQGDGEHYSGLAESLLILMQQHNLKEENVLYPMCDGHLGAEGATIVDQARERLGRG